MKDGYIVIRRNTGQPFTKETGHFKVYATRKAAKRYIYSQHEMTQYLDVRRVQVYINAN